MRKIYLLTASYLMAAGTMYAQVDAEQAYLPFQKETRSVVDHSHLVGLSSDRFPGEVLVSDDFSDPSNWIVSTLDGTTPEWEIVTTMPTSMNTFISPIASVTAANGFGVFNGIQYLLDGTVPPQNAVLELDETIDCSDAPAVSLRFTQAYRAFNVDRVFVEITNNDWAEVTSIELNMDEPTNGPTIQETIVLDITDAAAGYEFVKVRFRWEELVGDDLTGSGYGWMVDDLVVQEAWNYDQNLSAIYHRSGLGAFMENGMEYYQIAPSQATEIHFAGITNNLGAVVQEGAKLNVEVSGAGSFSATSFTVDLPIGGRDSLYTTPETFTPSAVGTYDVTCWVDSDSDEEETINDTLSLSFNVTDNHIYSRDDGFSFTSISNVTSNTNSPLTIGNVMEFFATDTIWAVDIVVSDAATNVGQFIYGQVMFFEEGSGTFIYEGQTDDHEITAGENGGIIKIFFNDPIIVPAGTNILLLAGHYGGDDEVEFRMAQPVDEQTVLGYTSGATTPFFLQTPSAIMVRADLTNEFFIGIDEENESNFAIGQNVPNPFSGSSVINYELNQAADVMIEFTDLSGKTVKTINYGAQDAGTYTVEIDANNFADGVYMYTFTVGDQKVTKRMTVNK